MNYWIHQNATLEGWKDRAIYAVNPDGEHIALSRDERYFLMTCDGSEQPPQELAERLLRAKVITCNAQEGKKPVLQMHPTLCRNTAVIAVTGRCNYQCRHCIAADGVEGSGDELSLETLCRLFDQMTELGIRRVWLTGGEPMLHRNYPEIVEAITARNMQLERILTNGSLLTQESLDQLRQCGQDPVFGVSFDGLGTHDWMRCHVGAEAKSLEAIDLAVRNGFRVMPHVNVNNVTAPRIIETCRVLVMEHGCTSLRLIPTSRSPRWEALAGADDNISYDAYFALMFELLRTAHEEKWSAYLDIRSLPAPDALEMLKHPPAPKSNACIMHWCPRTKNQFFVAHDGRILPCNAYEGTTKQYGFLCGDDINICHRPLADILTSSQYVDFCTERLENQFRDVEKCRTCKWAGVCCGGCPLFAIGNRLKLADENPNCSFYRGGWAERYIALMDELQA